MSGKSLFNMKVRISRSNHKRICSIFICCCLHFNIVCVVGFDTWKIHEWNYSQKISGKMHKLKSCSFPLASPPVKYQKRVQNVEKFKWSSRVTTVFNNNWNLWRFQWLCSGHFTREVENKNSVKWNGVNWNCEQKLSNVSYEYWILDKHWIVWAEINKTSKFNSNKNLTLWLINYSFEVFVSLFWFQNYKNSSHFC